MVFGCTLFGQEFLVFSEFSFKRVRGRKKSWSLNVKSFNQKYCAAGHTDTLHCFALQNLTEHITSSRFATFQNHFFPLPLTSCSLLGCLERNILARDTGIRRTLPLTMRACLIAVAAAFNVPAPMAPAPVAYATPATGYVPVEQTYLRGAVPSDFYLTGGGGWLLLIAQTLEGPFSAVSTLNLQNHI